MYEYKLTAIPTKGRSIKGRRGVSESFGVAIEDKMNKMSDEGWEFVEFREVPIIERRVLRANRTRTATMMLFKRLKNKAAEQRPFTVVTRPIHIDTSFEDVNLENSSDLHRIPPAIKKMMKRRERNLAQLQMAPNEKPN